MKTRYYAAGAAMALLAAIAFALAFSSLPASVPMHWDINGKPDGHGSPWSLFFLGPVLMAGMVAMFAVLPWLSPKRFEVEAFLRTYLNLMLIVEGLVGYFFAAALWAALTGTLDMSKAVVAGVCLASILIGNLLGKVRRNFFIGIRTPWTLASERVWYATHRLAGRVLVLLGLVALVAALAGIPAWIAFTLVTVGFAIPVVYSLVLYKRLERSHQLDAAG